MLLLLDRKPPGFADIPTPIHDGRVIEQVATTSFHVRLKLLDCGFYEVYFWDYHPNGRPFMHYFERVKNARRFYRQRVAQFLANA